MSKKPDAKKAGGSGAKGGGKKGAKGGADSDDELLEAMAAAAEKLAAAQPSGADGGKGGGAKKSASKAAAVAPPSSDGAAISAGAAAPPVDESLNPYPLVKPGKIRQTFPEPTVPVRAQFTDEDLPKGVIVPPPLEINAYRETSEEKRALERANSTMIFDLRRAAEVHRQVRRWTHTWLKPGLSLMTVADRIEAKLAQLVEKEGLLSGQAFPTGVSVNHIAAHYTPNTESDKYVLEPNDVLKVDFGVHYNGRIIDSAWTVAWNPRYDPLLEAVKAATNEGIKHAGIDVRLCDIGAAIQEVMESYEIELDGKVHRVKSIRNLSGHNIDPYVIHGGKSVPIVRGGEGVKMEEGELFAIETFGSTGKGQVNEDGECSHFAAMRGASSMPIRSDKAKALLRHIDKTFGTLPFCRKWLDRTGQEKHLLNLNALCDSGAVQKYPPLLDVKGCYTAQFEHTFVLKPTGKEILSRGDDY